MHRGIWRVLVVLAVLASGCDFGGSEAPGEADGEFFVEPGKEDNFLSTRAQEYMVEGTTTVTLETDLATAPEDVKMRRVKELIPLRQVVVGWFLNQYLQEKEHDSPNKDYGGFSALTKNGAYEELDIQAVDGLTYRFTFRQEFGGKMDLLKFLPTRIGADGRLQFDLVIGKISNDEMARLETNHEWYRSAPWSSFDPKTVDPSKLETIVLTVWPEPRSLDGWLDYNRLFADGRVTIGVHFGWDYHSEYHLKHSRDIYDWLVTVQGFKSPTDGYDAYFRTSGPLTKTFLANGKPVVAEVSLFWGKPGTEADPDTDAGGRVLEDDMKASFRDREVIVFSGHSGPFYGFALANWRKTDEGDLDDSKVPALDMPKDVYQVVLAEGCDTYGLGEAFRENRNKPGLQNLDVITTTSFSNASTANGVKDFLTAIVGGGATHQPKTWMELLGDLEDNSFWFNTMYGVHGIDDNPHAHPYAIPEAICKPCASASDCGGAGMRCTSGNGAKFCTYPCTADDGCPAGFKCQAVASGYTITSYQCMPSTQTCTVQPTPPTGPALIINEVFPAPEKSVDGDANGDGKLSASADEFVELVNVSGKDLDVSGWSLSDSVMVRIQFPAGTLLPAGKAMVVFGGGDPSKFGSLGGARIAVAKSKKLGLDNKGDKVILKDAKGTVVDQMSYGAEGAKGLSVVRQKDGDPAASFVTHPDVSHSAGLRTDGTPF